MLVTPNYPEMLVEIPFRADYPIARELKYTIFEDLYPKLDPTVLTNDPEGADSLKNGKGKFNYYNALSTGTSGITWSAHYSQQAAQASKSGDHGMAAFYSRSSATMAEVEAMEAEFEADMALRGAVLSALIIIEAALDADYQKATNTVHDWIVATTNSVGESAPEGSVLNLIFVNTVRVYKSFSAQHRITIKATAVLVDGSGNVLGCSRRMEQYGVNDDESLEKLKIKDREDRPDIIPKELIDAPAVEAVYENSLNEEGSLPYNLEILKVKGWSWGFRIHYVALANSMIKEICSQLDAFKED